MRSDRIVAVTMLLGVALAASAQEAKDKDKKQEQAAGKIRVCVALSQNSSTRAFTPVWQRTRLIDALNHAKPAKKAADQRRIEATPLPTEAGSAPDNRVCDYILKTTVTQLERAGDRQRPEDTTRMPPVIIGTQDPKPNDPQPLTRGRVDFTLRKGGSTLLESYVTAQERGSEDWVVTMLLDRIAQRVNDEAHRPPQVWRE
jgi:hypothetical protein